MQLLERNALREQIDSRLLENPIVLLVGPRQCGKTTLARQFAATHHAFYFDLESPLDAARLAEPMTALEPLEGFVVIDEAQLQPKLFELLRVLADRDPLPSRFLLLGSASPDLIRGASESLAGRVSIIPMSGFGLNEIPQQHLRRLWSRGGLPRSFLARTDATSRQWRADFIQTFLERDLRQFGVNVAPLSMRRFWMMVAHYHAQIWNASEIGRSLGEAHTTVKRHLDILCGAYVMRQLPPWFENLSKRQIKSPKVYVRDTGLLHELLGITDFARLESNPKLGASWEGFALEQVLSILGDRDAYFWHTQGGAELDLLNIVDGQRFGFEFKYADVPKISRSLTVAHQDLMLKHVFIVYPGRTTFAINDWATALSITELTPRLKELKT